MRWTETIQCGEGLSVVGAGEHDSLGYVCERLNAGEPLTSSLSPSLVTVIANREARAGSK
jgi:hypothetical protein